MNFDPTKFVPVAVMTKIPNTLLVRTDFPAKTAKEFMEYAKANPGKLNYGSQGNGTTSHLTAALLEKRAGLKFVHVPYKGTNPALNDLVAKHIDFIFMQMARAYSLHKGGKARILAVTLDKRVDHLPDIPTMAEVGVPDFESVTWNAITAPDVKEKLANLKMIPAGGSAADADAWYKLETKNWGEVIKDAGIKPQ